QFAGQQLGNFRRRLRVRAAIGLEAALPGLANRPSALADALAKALVDAVRHEELRVLRPAVEALGQADLLLAERVAMGCRGVLLVRRAVTDDAVDDDQGRAIAGAAERLQRLDETRPIVGVRYSQHVPAVAAKPGRDVLAEGELGVALDGDGVVVVDPAQV